MQVRIEINVDERLLKGPKWLARRPLLLAILLLGVGTATAFAVNDTVGDFVPNTPIIADKVNTRFTALYDAVTALEEHALDVNGVKYSTNAVFKATTTELHTSALSYTASGGATYYGYRAAKLICEDALQSVTAHMCTADELIRSAQIGIAAQNGWFSSGVRGLPDSKPGHDCLGWTDDTNLNAGHQWLATVQAPQGYPGAADCGTPLPVMCCDSP